MRPVPVGAKGTYTLRVTNARDIAWEPRTTAPPPSPFGVAAPHANEHERVLEKYGDVDMPLTVQGDMTDVIATIPTKKN